jgi:ribosome-interacting GTPase 1
MSEYRISSADIAIRCDATIDDLIDVLEAKSRKYIPVVYALNKIDSISIEELDLLYRYASYKGTCEGTCDYCC